MKKQLAKELVTIAKMIQAYDAEPKTLTLEQQQKLDNIKNMFTDYGKKLVEDSKGKVAEFLKKKAEIDALAEELKKFYAGYKEESPDGGKPVKIEGWKKTSGYDDFKKVGLEVLQENMQVGEKFVFLADIIEAEKKVSNRATPTEQLSILLSLVNEDTKRVWEEEVDKLHRTNTQISAVISAMEAKFVDYSDEAKAIAEKRGLTLKTSSVKVAFSFSGIFDKFVSIIKRAVDSVIKTISRQKSDNKKLVGKLDKLIDGLT